jgi:SAM-dependent methyltransferase
MTQKPYFRDVWALGPPQQKPSYPGAFPRGLIQMMRKKGWWGEKRLWLFSGSYKDPQGTTVDINPAVKPDFVANCEQLPFPDDSYDFVMLDPPYSEKEALELYNLPYINLPKVMNEAARVCCSGGLVVLLHRLAPFYGPWENQHKKRLKIKAIVGVVIIAGYSNIRALTVWQKYTALEQFIPARASGEAHICPP